MRSTCESALVLALTAAAVPAQTIWTAATPATAVPARDGAAASFDLRSGEVLMFGGAGNGGVLRNDLWAWDGTDWHTIATPHTPTGRRDAAMVSDGSGRTLLFGGTLAQAGGTFGPTDETWQFDGSDWIRSNAAPRPAARAGHALSVDSWGAVILFGGHDGSARRADTWSWDGQAWRLLSPSTVPPARTRAAMAYDEWRGRLVMFGGDGVGGRLADTWEWDGSDWQQLAPATTPSARAGHGMEFDAARRVVVLFGGEDRNGVSDETWEWDGSDWRLRSPTARPSPPRLGAALAYDPVHARTVLYGGRDSGGTVLADTWEYQPVWPATVRRLGHGCATTPYLTVTALPWLGELIELQLHNLYRPAGVAYVMFGTSDQAWGSYTLPLDLTFLGMPGCVAFTDLVAGQSLRHANGNGATGLYIPPLSRLLGGRLFVQAVVPDIRAAQTLGIAMSGALELVIGSR